MTTPFTVYDNATGRIKFGGELSPETLAHYVNMGEHMLVGVCGDPATHYVEALSLVEYTEAERGALAALHPGWVWQMPERIAVDARDLAYTKTHKNAEINQKRLEANRTSFAFAGKEIACDELSMLDIQSLNGIVTLIGDLPPGFQKQWKAIDNSYVAIPDKATWIGFIGSMVAAGQANFDHAQALKAALAAATTNADVDDITW